MGRPFVMNFLPDRLRVALWARFYRGRHSSRLAMYEAASMKYAPHVHMKLVPGDLISDCIAFTGVYEPALTRRLVELARTGGTLIDVGANLGYFTLLWVSANPTNRCIAFEACPRNITLLRRNIETNNFAEQVNLVPNAAGSASGRLYFDMGSSEQTGWGGFAAASASNAIEVDVVRIDDVVPASHPVALLKVDIEGADAWALMGCERLLKAGTVSEIWFEQNKPRSRALGINVDAAQDYLRSLGYTLYPQGNTECELVEWAARPATPR